MVEVEVAIKNIEGTKLAEDASSDTSVTFNASADISEGERSPGKLTLKFTIELSSNPEIVKLAVAGSALVTGEDQEIDTLLASNGEESAPPVFMKIYQKVYSIMYLLSGSLRIPYPSPGLLKGVHMASAKDMKQAVSNQQTV